MKADFLPIYSTYDDERLFAIIQSGTSDHGPKAVTAAHETLVKRGYPQDITVLLTDIFQHYPDQELISMVEADEGQYNSVTIEVAENLLSQRGYNIIGEGEEEDIQTKMEVPAPPEKDETDHVLKSDRLNRLITKKEVAVYKDSRLKQVFRQEPAQKLVAYQREIIRHGQELLLLKEPDGSKAYMRNWPNQVFLCKQCRVKEAPIDILMMSFSDFDAYKSSDDIVRGQLSKALEQTADSHIRRKNGSLYAVTIDRFKKDGKRYFTSNKIGFKSDISDRVKLGRLAKGTDFYLAQTEQEGKAIRIMTADGRHGILLSPPEMYREIKSPLEKTVSFIVASIFVIVALGIVLTILAKTGWFIFIGILLIPLFYVIYLFVGIPLYLILYELGKRF